MDTWGKYWNKLFKIKRTSVNFRCSQYFLANVPCQITRSISKINKATIFQREINKQNPLNHTNSVRKLIFEHFCLKLIASNKNESDNVMC